MFDAVTSSQPTEASGSVRREELGARLREARTRAVLTQQEVAESLCISRSAVSLIEKGQRRIDALELQRLSELYGRSVPELLGAASQGLPADAQELLDLVLKTASDVYNDRPATFLQPWRCWRR